MANFIEKAKRAGLAGIVLAALIATTGCAGPDMFRETRTEYIWQTSAGKIQQVREDWTGVDILRIEFYSKEGKEVAVFSTYKYIDATLQTEDNKFYTFNDGVANYSSSAKFPEHKKAKIPRVLETEIGVLRVLSEKGSDDYADTILQLEKDGKKIAEFNFDSDYKDAVVFQTDGNAYVREDGNDRIICSADAAKYLPNPGAEK